MTIEQILALWQRVKDMETEGLITAAEKNQAKNQLVAKAKGLIMNELA